MYHSEPTPFNLRMEQIQKQQQERRAREKERIRLIEYSDLLFLKSEGLIAYDPEGAISSTEFYGLYKSWCFAQKIPPKPARAFFLHIKKAAPSYNLSYSGNIRDSRGNRCRGFRGIRSVSGESA